MDTLVLFGLHLDNAEVVYIRNLDGVYSIIDVKYALSKPIPKLRTTLWFENARAQYKNELTALSK